MITDPTGTVTVPMIDATEIAPPGIVQQIPHNTMLLIQSQLQLIAPQAKVWETLQLATPANLTVMHVVLISRMHHSFKHASDSRATYRMERTMMVIEINVLCINRVYVNWKYYNHCNIK